MRVLGNILWHVPILGFLQAGSNFLIGTLLVLTVFAAPIGLGLIQYSKFLLAPFSYCMISDSELDTEKNKLWQTYSWIVRIIYIPFGLFFVLMILPQIFLLVISIFGIPVAIVIAKSLGTILNPVGKKCVPIAVSVELERRAAEKAVNKYLNTTQKSINERIENPSFSNVSKSDILANEMEHTKSIPLVQEDRKTETVPLVSEDRKTETVPLVPEDRKTETVPLVPEDRKTETVPLVQTENKTETISPVSVPKDIPLETVKNSSKHKPDVNSMKGYSPIMEAVCSLDRKNVEKLFQEGTPKLYFQAPDGKDAISLCIELRAWDILSLLAEKYDSKRIHQATYSKIITDNYDEYFGVEKIEQYAAIFLKLGIRLEEIQKTKVVEERNVVREPQQEIKQQEQFVKKAVLVIAPILATLLVIFFSYRWFTEDKKSPSTYYTPPSTSSNSSTSTYRPTTAENHSVVYGRILEPQGIRFRSGPGTQYEKRDILRHRERIKILDTNGPLETHNNVTGRWYKIEYNGTIGWIFGGFVDLE